MLKIIVQDNVLATGVTEHDGQQESPVVVLHVRIDSHPWRHASLCGWALPSVGLNRPVRRCT